MIVATIAGRVTKDAVLKTAGSHQVLEFDVAVNRKKNGEETVTFVRCSVWRERGVALEKHIRKGTNVAIVGSLDAKVYKEKVDLNVTVSELTLLGGGQRPEDLDF